MGSLGLYLGALQFAFAATWIVYVLFLPQLVVQAGLPKAAVGWILMLDQLIFVLADFACGVMADRVARVVGRVGAWVAGATLLSCAAFVALPFAAPGGSVPLLLVLIVVWSITSSALRAPLLALVGRHVTKPRQPALLGCWLLGLGVASALQPYLGLVLRGFDPRLPFVISSASLALLTLGLVAAEHRLAAQPAASAAEDAASPERPAEPTPLFVAVALLAALAFQVHVFIDSGPLYTRLAGAGSLPTLMPLFWIGFNLGLFPLSIACKRHTAPRVMAAAAIAAAAFAWAAPMAPSLPLLVTSQVLAGAAWAGVITAAFAWALSRGGSGRAGTYAGMLSSVLALATLARMASVGAGWPKDAAIGAALFWWPFLGWLLAAVLLSWLQASRAISRRAASTNT